MRFRLTLTAALLAAAAPAAAVTNFTSDFDGFTIGGPGYANFSSIDGWDGGSNGIEVQSSGIAGSPGTGTNLVELDTTANSWMSRGVDAGVYSLNFDYSARPGTAAATNGVGVWLDNTLLGTFSANGTNATDTNWLNVALNFTAQAAGTLKFAALGASDSFGGYIDTVALAGTALPVPEPGEWAMLIAGLGVVGFVGRKHADRRAHGALQ